MLPDLIPYAKSTAKSKVGFFVMQLVPSSMFLKQVQVLFLAPQIA